MKDFIIKMPELDQEQLSWARASFDSPAGQIKTAWRREAGKTELEVIVPPNCRGRLKLPEHMLSAMIRESKYVKVAEVKNGYGLVLLSSGKYIFKM